MNKIQQIEEVVRKECPWLMELSFGCLIRYGDDEPQIYCTPENDDDHVATVYTKTNRIEKVEDMEDFEIIGHPIQLSDILYVIGKNTNRKICIQANGVVIEWVGNTYDTERKEVLANYKFQLPFKNQLEETINFLFEIICKEKN